MFFRFYAESLFLDGIDSQIKNFLNSNLIFFDFQIKPVLQFKGKIKLDYLEMKSRNLEIIEYFKGVANALYG